MVDPNSKVPDDPDLYFKVVDPKLQVADLNAGVGELRSGRIPQFNPCSQVSFTATHKLPTDTVADLSYEASRNSHTRRPQHESTKVLTARIQF